MLLNNAIVLVQMMVFLLSDIGQIRSLLWGDFYGAGPFGKPRQFGFLDPRGATMAPAVPLLTGSTINTYIYLHDNAGGLDGTVVPTAALIDEGHYGIGTPWPDADGGVRITHLSIEDLGMGY